MERFVAVLTLSLAFAGCGGSDGGDNAKCYPLGLAALKADWCRGAHTLCRDKFGLSDAEFAVKYGATGDECWRNRHVSLIDSVIASVVRTDGGTGGASEGGADAGCGDAGADGGGMCYAPPPPMWLEPGWEEAEKLLESNEAFHNCQRHFWRYDDPTYCDAIVTDEPYRPGGVCSPEVLRGEIPPPVTYAICGA